MKFFIKHKILIILISLLFFSSINTQDVESEVMEINIFNNITVLMSSSHITLRLVQNQQEVNKTNKYVGTFEIITKPSNTNFKLW
jgi:hypothetical protein